MIRLISNFDDYKLLDIGNGEKVEVWGKYKLIRPDPQIIWEAKQNTQLWKDYDARYIRSKSGGGNWEYKTRLPERWQIKYKELVFNIKPMGFKHVGLFPEQAVNWDFMMDKISKEKKEREKRGDNNPVRVLNLFAYTGGATIACSSAGAEVCHVDSSKGMVTWAKENAKSSGLESHVIRYIVDDTVKFVQREIRRGNKYDCIVMDPPVYGRGANGEVWDIEKDLYNLVKLCSELLTPAPLFFIINSYTCSLSCELLKQLVEVTVKNKVLTGKVSSTEIGIPVEGSDMVLPCGNTTIWER